MASFPLHGGYLKWAEENIGPGEYVDFSTSVNPFGPSPRVLEAAREALGRIDRYPDPDYSRLREAAAACYGVDPENVLPGNGAAEFFYLLAVTLRPRQAVLLDPSFADYRRAARAAGGRVESLILGPPFAFGEEEAVGLLRLIGPGSLVILGQPNNPTGRLVPPRLLLRVLKACEASGSVLVLDESFLDFVPGGEELSFAARTRETDSLVVLRSLTKVHSIPGLRLGFCIASPAVTGRFEVARQSWSVNLVAEAAGVAALKDREFTKESLRVLGRWGDLFFSRLAAIPGLIVYPSSANFHLMYAPGPDLAVRLARRGILVRDCRNFPGLRPGYFRAAVREPEENERLAEALEDVLADS